MAAIAVIISLSGCAVSPPTAWRVEPVEFDSAMDGGSARMTDVAYPMEQIASDTEGGFWTESAGSWLHLDKNGDTVRRFNDDLFMTVHGISAVSPTVLAVSRTDREDESGSGSGLFLFDTDSGDWTTVHGAETTTGDVVVDAVGRLIFVDFLGQIVPRGGGGSHEEAVPLPFAIRTVDSTGSVTTLLDPDAGQRAVAVAIDVDASGTVYVGTERETFSVGVDGRRTDLGIHREQRPVLAVSAAGIVLAPGQNTTESDAEWVIEGGSTDARDVMDLWKCENVRVSGLTIRTSATVTGLPFACGVRGAEWLDESHLLISLGDESGGVLARVTRPEAR